MTFEAPSSSRDYILEQLFNQASSVRRTFEESSHYASSKRKHTVSSATAAAAQHMASLNRKRKFQHRIWTAPTSVVPVATPFSYSLLAAAAADIDEEAIALPSSQGSSKKARFTFHSPISRYTWLDKDPMQPQLAPSLAPTNCAVEAPRLAQPLDIVLKAHPADFTLTYNDVICGSGATTSSLIGNQRFKVWIDAHKSSFARSSSLYQDSQIARSVVNTVTSSVPPGRFLSLDMRTGLWFDVGYERAVDIALEALATESKEGSLLAKMMTNKICSGGGGILKQTSSSGGGTMRQAAGGGGILKQTSSSGGGTMRQAAQILPRVLTSKAA